MRKFQSFCLLVLASGFIYLFTFIFGFAHVPATVEVERQRVIFFDKKADVVLQAMHGQPISYKDYQQFVGDLVISKNVYFQDALRKKGVTDKQFLKLRFAPTFVRAEVQK